MNDSSWRSPRALRRPLVVLLTLALTMALRAMLRAEPVVPFLFLVLVLSLLQWIVAVENPLERWRRFATGPLRLMAAAGVGLLAASAVPPLVRWVVRSLLRDSLGWVGWVLTEAVHIPGFRVALSLAMACRAVQLLGDSGQKRWVTSLPWPSTSLLIWALLAPGDLGRVLDVHWNWQILLVVAGGVLLSLPLALLVVTPNHDPGMRLRWPLPLVWKAVALVLLDWSLWVVAMTRMA